MCPEISCCRLMRHVTITAYGCEVKSKPALIIVLLVIAVVAAGVAVYSATSTPSAAPTPHTSTPAQDAPRESERSRENLPAAPAGLENFYGQTPQWGPCDEGGQEWDCATVQVPLDYEKPDGKTIDIALKRLKGANAKASLFVNFGGPGGSGTETVTDWAGSALSAEMRANFDIIGFDPRGVHKSSGVRCRTDAELDEDNAEYDYGRGEEYLKKIQDDAKKLAEKCKENNDPELLANINTISAVRDLDVLRDAVGDPKLTYIGYSYGTLLGARYADTFPQNVGPFLLDSAVDPSLNGAQLGAGQARGFEASVRNFMQTCLDQGSSCPFTGSVDEGLQQLLAFFDKANKNPIPTTDKQRPLTAGHALSVVISAQYSPQFLTDLTIEGLAAAMQNNDGSQLLTIMDLLNERDPSGKYKTNQDDALILIRAADEGPGSTDPAEWEKLNEQILKDAPIMGRFFLYNDASRAAFDIKPTGVTGPVKAAGAGPILVVGSKGDPATIYEWSEALVAQLESAHLITYDGWGHGIFGGQSTCVDDAVENYFLRGEMPTDNLVCN